MPITDAELVDRAKDLLARADPKEVDQLTFRGAQFDAGLAWVHFPVGFGGLGINRGRRNIVDQVLREGRRPYHDWFVKFTGIGMGAPTILPYGPEEMMDLRSRANTIEGGTSEIQRNILGERVLGLPPDVRVDKGVPWRDLPR
jgi:hypothetical protein